MLSPFGDSVDWELLILATSSWIGTRRSPVPRWHADNARPGLLLLLRPGDGIPLHESRLHGPLEHAGEPRPVPVDGGATERPPLWEEESPNGAIPFSASEMVHNASLAPTPSERPDSLSDRDLGTARAGYYVFATHSRLAAERIIVLPDHGVKRRTG